MTPLPKQPTSEEIVALIQNSGRRVMRANADVCLYTVLDND